MPAEKTAMSPVALFQVVVPAVPALDEVQFAVAASQAPAAVVPALAPPVLPLVSQTSVAARPSCGAKAVDASAAPAATCSTRRARRRKNRGTGLRFVFSVVTCTPTLRS